MKNNNLKNKINYWISICKYDLKTAKVMLKGKRYLYVGFMCHQSIEKILKAYYVFLKKEIPPYTHNLRYLSEQTNLLKTFSEGTITFITEIEPLNIEARYPHHKKKIFKSLTKKRCEKS